MKETHSDFNTRTNYINDRIIYWSLLSYFYTRLNGSEIGRIRFERHKRHRITIDYNILTGQLKEKKNQFVRR